VAGAARRLSLRLGPEPRHSGVPRGQGGGADGPAGLELLAEVEDDERLAGRHRVAAVRGHLLELAGDTAGAAAAFETAATLTTSLPERQYLQRRAVAARAPG
jgi:predicted RNA polymerase sigma factor